MTSVRITAFGVVSPLGNSAEAMARRFAAGERGRVSGDAGMLVEEIPIGAVPPDKRSRVGRLDRFCRLFLSATYLACDAAQLDLDSMDRQRVGLSFGTGLGCLLTDEEYNRKIVESGPAAASPRLFAYTVSSAAAGEVSIALGITGPNVTSHMGLSAGLGAIGYGVDLIRMGKADVVIAGGADAGGAAIGEALRDMGLWKEPSRSRPFGDAVPGICPGEGAVVAVLEREGLVERRGVVPWGRVEGYAAGFEPALAGRVKSSGGVGAAMRRALAASGRRAGGIGLVLSSAHGTPLDEVEHQSAMEVFGDSDKALVLAPKTALGDGFGAAGVLSLALAAGVMRHRPRLADGVGLALDGKSIAADDANRRMRSASVAMVNALCYSGNIVSLIFSPTSSV